VSSKNWLEEELEGYDDIDIEEEVIDHRDSNILKAERHQRKLRRQREAEKREQEEAS